MRGSSYHTKTKPVLVLTKVNCLLPIKNMRENIAFTNADFLLFCGQEFLAADNSSCVGYVGIIPVMWVRLDQGIIDMNRNGNFCTGT